MKFTRIILSLIFLLIFQTAGYTNTDQSVEPAEKYLLKINEKEFQIELNEYLVLSDSKIKLTIEPNKKFNYGGVHFEYPRYFTFEAKLKKHYKFWTLSGNDVKIMIHNYKVNTDHKAMANSLMDVFGKDKCRQVKCEMKVPNRTLHGTKIIITTNKLKFSQEVYSFKNSTGSMLLIIQDSISASGVNTAEYSVVTKKFQKLFRVDE